MVPSVHRAMEEGTPRRPGWNDLGRRARTWRVVHTVWSAAELGSLAFIWRGAATGQRSRRLWLCVGLLGVEGVALAGGRGNCPMANLQAGWGDPIPFFELVLPPRAVRAAVPALALLSAGGIGAVVVQGRGVAWTDG